MPAPRTAPAPQLGRASGLLATALCGLLALAVGPQTGCTIRRTTPAPIDKPAYVHRVGPGDVLTIEVFDEDLTRDVTVSPDGRIAFPLAGDMDVLDLTLQQVQATVTERLKSYLTKPLVNVVLAESRSARVIVLGEVQTQGVQPYHERLSVTEALAIARINWPTAKSEDVRIIRGSLDDPTLIEVDLENVLLAAEKDIFLEPGDIVLLPPKHVTVMARYVPQVLSPISTIVGMGRSVATRSATGGF